MPNAVLRPALSSRIPALEADVDNYPEHSARLRTTTLHTPIETGGSVVDHAVAEPPTVTLTGMVSSFTDVTGRSPADAWAAVRRLHLEVTPVTIHTPWGTYREMLIERAQARQFGQGLRFLIEATQILRVGAPVDVLSPESITGPAASRSSSIDRGRVSTVGLAPLEARSLELNTLSSTLPSITPRTFARMVMDDSGGFRFNAAEIARTIRGAPNLARSKVIDIARELPGLPSDGVVEILRAADDVTQAEVLGVARDLPLDVDDVSRMIQQFPSPI